MDTGNTPTSIAGKAVGRIGYGLLSEYWSEEAVVISSLSWYAKLITDAI